MAVLTAPKPVQRGLGSLRSNPSAPWRHVDLTIIGCVMSITVLGSVMVYSATRGSDPEAIDSSFLGRQILFVGLGIAVAAFTAWFDYRRLRDFAMIGYVAVVLSLLVVISPLGTESKGTQAWFQLGSFQLQPSEFAKLILIVTVASVLAQFGGDIDLARLAGVLTLIGIPLVLILLQPDLGTALVFVSIMMGMLLVGGAHVRHIVVLTLVGLIAVIGILNSGVLEDYQTDRLTTFLNQDEDLQTSTYNLNQSKIAIGAGGFTGQGLFEGSQTRLGIVPEQHTDFIFTAVGEELGFIGAGTILILFSIIGFRIWRTAQLARDPLGTFICVGILSMLVFQVFQNIGMTMGIMPITGIPLPFMSYGGSNTLMAFAAIGLVLNVHMRRFS
ncbi:MAG TPA: rod shape-determining protein RodA [Acidimicrobiales bacterium]|nr:rod shape-determining protein RodA [Acidimicrobiales bacterium]